MPCKQRVAPSLSFRGLDLIGAGSRPERSESASERLVLSERGQMITIGVDAHKHVHVALALDEAGRERTGGEGQTARLAGARCQAGRPSFLAIHSGGLKAPGATEEGLLSISYMRARRSSK